MGVSFTRHFKNFHMFHFYVLKTVIGLQGSLNMLAHSKSESVT